MLYAIRNSLVILAISAASSLLGQVTVSDIWSSSNDLGIINDVAIDKVEGGVYHAGKSDGKWSVTKYDAQGTEIWSLYDQTSDLSEISKIEVTNEGHILITGYIKGTASFPDNPYDQSVHTFTSVGQSDAFIACYSSEGNYTWANIYGKSNYDLGISLDVMDGFVYAILGGQSNGSTTILDIPATDSNTKLILVKLDLLGNVIDYVFFNSNYNFMEVTDDTHLSSIFQRLKFDISKYESQIFIAAAYKGDLLIQDSSSGVLYFTNTAHTATDALLIAVFNDDLSIDWLTQVEQDDITGDILGLGITADCSGIFLAGGAKFSGPNKRFYYYDGISHTVSSSQTFNQTNQAFVLKYDLSGSFQWLKSRAFEDPSTYNSAAYYDVVSDETGLVWAIGHANASPYDSGSGPSTVLFDGSSEVDQGYPDTGKPRNVFYDAINTDSGVIESFQTWSNAGNQAGYAIDAVTFNNTHYLCLGGATAVKTRIADATFSLISYETTSPSIGPSCCSVVELININSPSNPTGEFCYDANISLATGTPETNWSMVNMSNINKRIGQGSNILYYPTKPEFDIVAYNTTSCGVVITDTMHFAVNNLPPEITIAPTQNIILSAGQCSVNNTEILDPSITINCPADTQLVTTPRFPYNFNPGTTEVSYKLQSEAIPVRNVRRSNRTNTSKVFPYPLNVTFDNLGIGENNRILGSNTLGADAVVTFPSTTCANGDCLSSSNVDMVSTVIDKGPGGFDFNVVSDSTVNSSTDYSSITVQIGQTLRLNGDITVRILNNINILENAKIIVNGNVTIITNTLTLDYRGLIRLRNGSLRILSENDVALGNKAKIVKANKFFDLFLYTKNDMYVNAGAKLDGLFYATDSLVLGNENRVIGSLTGGSVDINQNNSIRYNDAGISLFENYFGIVPENSAVILGIAASAADSLLYFENGIHPLADYAAFDANYTEGSGLTWSIDPIEDYNLFHINPTSGVLSFNNSPDYESPDDTHNVPTDNIYEVTIRLTNSLLETNTRKIKIFVQNVPTQNSIALTDIIVGDPAGPVLNCIDTNLDNDISLCVSNVTALTDLTPPTIDAGCYNIESISSPQTFPFDFPVGTNPITYNVSAELIPDVNLLSTSDLSTSKNTFPKAANSTGDPAVFGSNNTIIASDGIASELVTIGAGTTCEGGPCSNYTNVDSLNFNVDVGMSSIDYDINDDTTINTNADYKEIKLDQDKTLTIINNTTIRASETFTLKENSTILIDGNVTISCKHFIFENNAEIIIQSGSLLLESSKDFAFNDHSKITKSNPGLESVILCFDDVRIQNSTEINALIYARHRFELRNSNNITGAISAEIITIDDDNLISFDNSSFNLFNTRLSKSVGVDPVIHSYSAGTVDLIEFPENGSSPIIDYLGTDDIDSEGSNLLWSIGPSLDGTNFTIDPILGVLSFVDIPDFENPLDSDLDNIYELQIMLQDNDGNIDTNDIRITIVDLQTVTNSCNSNVIVTDIENPSVFCSNSTIGLNGSGDASIMPSDVVSFSSDNCGTPTINLSGDAFTCSELGANTITVTATDANSNMASCDAIVTIIDSENPLVTCSPITINLDASGNAILAPTDIENASSDNCGTPTLSINNSSFDCTNVGLNTVTLTATDGSSNSSSCDAIVTIVDATNPIASCQNITVTLDNFGNASVPYLDINNGSSDACGIFQYSPNTTSFNCSDIGPNTITLTVEDNNGNTSNCDAIVTIIDSAAPSVSCKDATISLNSAGNAMITPLDVVLLHSDNCGFPTFTLSKSSFICPDLGINTITVTAEDASGNTSSCTSDVSIVDDEAPTAICQDITIDLDLIGSPDIVFTDINSGSTENCGAIYFVSLSQNDFPSIGDYTVDLTMRDASDNMSSCSAIVSVIDDDAPTAICQDFAADLGPTGIVNIMLSDIDNGSSDNVGISNLFLSDSDFNCSEIGPNNITLTVEDAAGNSASCSAVVTVSDNLPPSVVCQNITLDLDASGDAVITSGNVVSSSSDNCTTHDLILSNTTFNCLDVGANTITVTASDPYSNTATCDAVVNVVDNVDPTAICQNISVDLDSFGDANIVAGDIDGGSNDACGVANIVSDITSFTNADLGTNNVSLIVTDSNGNSSNCVAVVTINDNNPPIAMCQDITVDLDVSGNVSIVPADIDNFSSDNGTIAGMSLDIMDFTCSDIGLNAVTLAVTDNAGNTSFCSGNVTVLDNNGPALSCTSYTVNLDGTGNVIIDSADLVTLSSDNCGVTSTILSQSVFDCMNIGSNSVIITATDAAGNSTNCTSIVTINDDINPTAVCQDITVGLDVNEQATITETDIDDGSSDNCNVASLSADQTFFTSAHIGDNNVTLTATDDGGLTSNCVAIVTILDTNAPIALCQNITVPLDGSGNASITAAEIDNGSTDNGVIVSSVLDITAFDCTNIGSNNVILTLTDNASNISTCPALVTIVDNETPSASTNDITVYLNTLGQVSISSSDVLVSASDNCGMPSFALDQYDFDCSHIGANTVNWTASDASGNFDFDALTVTVLDTISPMPICQDITVSLDGTGNASFTAAEINNGSNDACGVASIVSNITAFNNANLGANNVTLTVTDNNGNSSNCEAIVTISDNNAPVAVCQNITIQLDATGNVSIADTDIDGGSTDNGSISSIVASQLDFDCSHVGTNDVTLLVTDDATNVDDCIAVVTVEDNTDPVVTCDDITVQLDVLGNASIIATDVENTSSDICGAPSLIIDLGDFACSEIGTNNVILTATDVNGNTSNCVAIVTVEDNINPAPLCQNISLGLDAMGNASLVAGDIDGGSSDACGIASIISDISTFTNADLGPNNVTLTVTDNYGNSSDCIAVVTVSDNNAPVAVCQDITIQLDATGNVSITDGDIDGGSTDNGLIASIVASQLDFDCSHLGTNNITLTATDDSGNMDDCIAIVSVEETFDPVVVCDDITVQLDATGNVSISPTDVENSSNDLCAAPILSIDNTNFSCADVGVNVVVLTATDINGDQGDCTANVTVVDITNPTAICQDIAVALDLSGIALLTGTEINNGSSDACGIISFDSDISSFTDSDLGPNNVILTVTDVNGNTDNCISVVTVFDINPPVANCQDISVVLDSTGSAIINPAMIDNGSTDNGSITTMVLDQTSFNCFNTGANSVTLTVTDNASNDATCLSNVTVIDDQSPYVICSPIILDLDANGMVSISPYDFGTSTIENCGPADHDLNKSDFDCTNIGVNSITITATDASSNTGTCTTTLTVNDNTNPIALCQNITVGLDSFGVVSIDANSIDNGSNDGCGIASVLLNTTDFTNANLGDNVVELTVTDVNGNFSTCDAVVNITDSNAPNAICQDISVDLDGSGSVSVLSDDIDNGSTDNGNIISMTLDITEFDCTNIGDNTVTLVLTDDAANVSNCTAIVTVSDVEDPSITCQNHTASLNEFGLVMITSTEVVFSSSDNCGTPDLILSQSNFDCSDIGVQSITVTADDNNGNTSFCTVEVSIQDTISPIANCMDFSVGLNGSGEANILPSQANNNSTDNCGLNPVGFTVSPSMFTSVNLGANTVTLTIIDVNGYTSFCESIVTVEDTNAPTAICQDSISVSLDLAGMASIIADDINNGSTDNGIILSLDLDNDTFDCTNLGLNTVTLNVTDDASNVSSCSSIVIVTDEIAPVVNCTNLTATLDSTGILNIIPEDVTIDSNDNCGVPELTVNVDSFDCDQMGLNTIIVTATDGSGNVSTCTSDVQIQDTTSPTAMCQDITISLDGSGNASINPQDVDNGSFISCGTPDFELDNEDFTNVNLGDNIVTLTVIHENGSTDECSAIVTVTDDSAPIAICQDVDFYLDNSGSGIISGAQINNGSSDNGGIASLVANPSEFTCADIGLVNVTLTVTDNNGNSSDCNSVVTVIDDIEPVITCFDINIQLDENGSASIVLSDVIDTATDNCIGLLTPVINMETFNCTPGDNDVIATIQDASGNIGSCTSTVTVMPYNAPVVLNQEFCSGDNPTVADLILPTGNFNLYNGVGDLLTNTSSIVTGTFSAAYITGLCEGDRATFDVVVNQTPVAPEFPSVVYYCPGDWPNIDSLLTNIVGSEIGTLMVYSDQFGGSLYTSGTQPVNDGSLYWIADEINGCASARTGVLVEISDGSELPVAICNSNTINITLDETSAMATLNVSDVDDGSSLETDCFDLTLSLSQTDFGCEDLGVTNMVTLTASASNGQSTSCQSNVNVITSEVPVITCPGDQTVSLVTDCNFNLDDYTTEYLSIVHGCISENNFTVTQTSNPELEPGPNEWLDSYTELEITLTATSDLTSSTSCTFNVALAQSNTLTISYPDDYMGETDINECGATIPGGSIQAPIVENGCHINIENNLGLDFSLPAFFESGQTDIVWSISAMAHEPITYTQTITVLDFQAPNIACPDTVRQCLTPVLQDLSLGEEFYSDYCALATNPISATMESIGQEYYVEWTVTDDAGNDNSCTQVIIDLEVVSTPDAGPDQVLNSLFVNELIGNTPEIGTVEWLGSDAVIIEDPYNPISAVSNLSQGENEFVYQISEPGCISLTDTVLYTVTEFFMPTGFSPNGDNVNDLLVIRGVLAYPENTFTIFDRKGKRVYSVDGYKNDWDGTGNGGAQLPKDTYFYILEFENGTSYKGSIEIKY